MRLLERMLIGAIAASTTGVLTPAWAATPTVFEGSAKMNTVSAGCGGTITAGEFFVSILRPQFTASEPPVGISFVSTRSAALYILNGAARPVPPSGNYDGQGISSRAAFFHSNGPFTGAFSMKAAPASVSPTTPFVTLTGKLTNFADLTGCTVTFSASYELRTD